MDVVIFGWAAKLRNVLQPLKRRPDCVHRTLSGFRIADVKKLPDPFDVRECVVSKQDHEMGRGVGLGNSRSVPQLSTQRLIS